jgi:hypothetical protein
MLDTLLAWFRHLSRICGFDTADAFPPGHPHARTRWKAAYFDIASDVKPEQIERRLCEAIRNTPLVFAYIINPTPAMQRALFAVLDERLRRGGNTSELVLLLIAAYDSPHIQEAVPGLRAAIEGDAHDSQTERVRKVLAFLAQMHTPFDVIELDSYRRRRSRR